ncbi:RadC family protein [Brevundimonas staleyi]|uniref:DNA repair protein RadC n=1 Tax=Brevundimonas staleyi TaxID=74326 RepID=A0ABW0FW87_9CAUL
MRPTPDRRRKETEEPIARAAALDDAALLSILLGSPAAAPPQDRPARGLLARFGSLGEVLAAPARELHRIEGVGPEVVERLALTRELGFRLARSRALADSLPSGWSALVGYVRTRLASLTRERFLALFLDADDRLVAEELVAEGTVDHAPVYPREVVRRALEVSASGLVLVHNHPSGDPAPSRADIAVTRLIVEAAAVFDLRVHDHLIVAREGTASFRALGLM